MFKNIVVFCIHYSFFLVLCIYIFLLELHFYLLCCLLNLYFFNVKMNLQSCNMVLLVLTKNWACMHEIFVNYIVILTGMLHREWE